MKFIKNKGDETIINATKKENRKAGWRDYLF